MKRWIPLGAALMIGCGGTSSPAGTSPSDAGGDDAADAPTPSGGLHVTTIDVNGVDKVDLLLMVDNSASMADKFDELAKRIPSLVKALVAPDADPASGKPRTSPIVDLHVGIITSSLGGHGTSVCDATINPHADDHGHLLPRAGENGTQGYTVATVGGTPTPVACPSPVAASALAWAFDPNDASARFKGAAQVDPMEAGVACVVESAKEDGCGYEAQLESIYRFLIDPAPYLTADAQCQKSPSGDNCGQNRITPTGVDQEILKERAAFLRPDSLLAVVMLTDENDGSILPAGLNWLPLAYGKGTMARGWKGCESVPDDFEPQSQADYATLKNTYDCQSCFQPGADPGGNCSVPWATTPLDNDVDGRNERMLQQTRRYGYNFLWGRQRYVDAFSATMVPASDGTVQPNPIFKGGMRTKDLVLVAGILGVPKRLLPSKADGSLADLAESDWDKLVSPDLGKRDPHMIEQIAPRAGVPMFAGDRGVDPDNGGDRHVVSGDDLQYACIAPRTVASAGADCAAPNANQTSPLCDVVGGAVEQTYFKAYPTLRELRVLHELGAKGVATVVSSICDASYQRAIDAIAAKLQKPLAAPTICAPKPVDVSAAGFASCAIFEIFADAHPGGATSCEAIAGAHSAYCTPGAAPCQVPDTTLPPISPASAAANLQLSIAVTAPDGTTTHEATTPALDADGNVYATASDGVRHLVCEVAPIEGNPAFDATTQTACAQDASFSMAAGSGGGWCWTTNAALASSCANGVMRLVGDAIPQNGTQLAYGCL